MSTPPPVDAPPPHVPVAESEQGSERYALYVPRILQQHLLERPEEACWSAAGTAAFVDIAGFTALSELLARKGREGAEQIAEVIGRAFDALLAFAYGLGGSLLKFGGDALLLWFEGDEHTVRAAHAALGMRDVLDEVGRIRLPDAEVTLQMSQALHAGTFHFFAVGDAHVELLPVGPAWSRLVAAEQAASARTILVTDTAAAVLPEAILGSAHGGGRFLVGAPGSAPPRQARRPRPALAPTILARCLAPAVRNHVRAGSVASEHRPVTIAFLRFEGTDALIASVGVEATARALHTMLVAVEAATQAQDVALLASDLDADGGKLILTAGAPKVTGDDEERMLLAVRRILETELPLPVRIGVHRGPVFAGDIGPTYRRTYTVMGDSVNLAARLMAKAERGQALVTQGVLERSNTMFEAAAIAPFAVKGKLEPIHAWSLGRARGSRTRSTATKRLALTGRNDALAVLRRILGGMRAGSGHLVLVTGQPGVGKTRLLEAARDAAVGFRKVHNTCEAYTASLPYAVWRDLLRELTGVPREAADAEVAARIHELTAEKAPELAPWLPLVGVALGLALDPTPEVEMLAERHRRAKLHDVVARFLDVVAQGPTFIEIENAHHMDEASAELLAALVSSLATHRWLFAVARRPAPGGFAPSESPHVTTLPIQPLAAPDALRLAQLASQATPLPAHVLEAVAQRSGGNPQFLRDLVDFAVQSGGIVGLPESAEAAALARIDALVPEDRAIVRRAAVFGLTFHPRMLAWFDDEDDAPAASPEAWQRLADVFEEDGEGYYRFRQSLLRDTAYESLPFKLRRRLHATVAARIAAEAVHPDEVAGPLSLHFAAAGDDASTWRYATLAARRAEGAYAFVEAAGLYTRALEAGTKLAHVARLEIARVQEAVADAWYRAGEYRKALDAYRAVQAQVAGERLLEADVLFKLSRVEEKLGRYPEALRWVDRAREALQSEPGIEAQRQLARASAWYATVLQAEGHTSEALAWAERAAREADEVDDPEELGNAYFVMGWAHGLLGKPGGEALMQKALVAFQRSGNRVTQASILSNLGAACYWEGRWDDAMAYYERGRDASAQVGNLVNAAAASMNIAEILADRGEHAQAEAMLQQTLPVWRSSEYRYFLGACLWLLGRVALRANRLPEAAARLTEARALLDEIGAEHEVQDIDARLAECRLLEGQAEAALAQCDAILARGEPADAIDRLTPLLQRARGYALLLLADPFGAREAFETSAQRARARNDRFELVLTLNALVGLDRLEGIEPPQAMVDECNEILAALKVRALPPTPSIP